MAVNGDSQRDTSLLTAALPLVLTKHPDIAEHLLFSGNSAVHALAAAAVYHTLVVEVAIAGSIGLEAISHDKEGSRPCCPGHSMKSKLLAVLRTPRHAALVKVLRFVHECPTHSPTAISQLTRSSDRLETWDFASSLLGQLTEVVELSWQTGFGVGGELWKVGKARKRLELTHPPLHPGHTGTPVYPRLAPGLQESGNGGPRAVGLNGRALGVGWESLEVLCLDGLSAAGARTIASHLLILATQVERLTPRLHSLTLGTHFADLRLCQAVGQFGALGSLRHITLSTSGTKLKDECLQVILEQCTSLESLCLDDVEGRMTESVWSKIQFWPPSLTSLEVNLAETGWVLKHLSSIHVVPFKQLERFAVRRVPHPMATLPFPPSNIAVPATLPTHTTELIPYDLVYMISKNGGRIKHLALDWWQLTDPNLEELLAGCPNLRTLRISVKSTPLDIIGMTTAFAHVPELQYLSLRSPHLLRAAAQKSKPKRKSISTDPTLPAFLAERVAENDPSLLETRDLRKFSRRMPNLHTLVWATKGEWTFRKKSTSPIDFTHSAISTARVWAECQRQPPNFDFADTGGSDEILEPPVTDSPSLTRTPSSASVPACDIPPKSIICVPSLPPTPAPHPHWTAARTKVTLHPQPQPQPSPAKDSRRRAKSIPKERHVPGSARANAAKKPPDPEDGWTTVDRKKK